MNMWDNNYVLNHEDIENITRALDQQVAMDSAYSCEDNTCGAYKEKSILDIVSRQNQPEGLSTNCSASDTFNEDSTSMRDGSVEQRQEDLAYTSSIDACWSWLVKKLESIKEEREFIEAGTALIEVVDPTGYPHEKT